MKLFFSLCFFVLSAALSSAQTTPTASQPTQSVVLSEEGDGPVILFDKTEITQAQLADMDEQNIGDIQILTGEQAHARFGKYKKNGAIVISSTPPADVIQPTDLDAIVPAAPAEQVTDAVSDEVKMSFGSDLKAHIVIDGKPSSMEKLQAMSPSQIKSMEVMKGDAATKKYGDLAKDGAIEVTTKQ